MREGKIGSLNVTDGRQDFTYFYAALNDSEFGFAFSLTPTDKVSKLPESILQLTGR